MRVVVGVTPSSSTALAEQRVDERALARVELADHDQQEQLVELPDRAAERLASSPGASRRASTAAGPRAASAPRPAAASAPRSGARSPSTLASDRGAVGIPPMSAPPSSTPAFASYTMAWAMPWLPAISNRDVPARLQQGAGCRATGRTARTRIRSGSHWWWKRGASMRLLHVHAEVHHVRGSSSSTVLMMVRPPGLPTARNSLPSFARMVGRHAGEHALAGRGQVGLGADEARLRR